MDIMKDAVMSPCGHSFSKDTIEKWLNQNSSCPLCKEPITAEQLIANYALRATIAQYLALKENPYMEEQQILEEVMGVPEETSVELRKPLKMWTVADVSVWLLNFTEWLPENALTSQQQWQINGKQLNKMNKKEIQKYFILDQERAKLLSEEVSKIRKVSKKISKSYRHSSSLSQESIGVSNVHIQLTNTIHSSAPESTWSNFKKKAKKVFHCTEEDIEAAKQSPYGCGSCECRHCGVCQCATFFADELRLKGVPVSCSVVLCDCCYGRRSTYKLRTIGAFLFPLVVVIVILLFIFEVAIWLTFGIFILLVLMCLIGLQ